MFISSDMNTWVLGGATLWCNNMFMSKYSIFCIIGFVFERNRMCLFQL